MWCYKDGVVVVDTPVVTGNVSKGYDTPSGSVWAIDAKKHDASLKRRRLYTACNLLDAV